MDGSENISALLLGKDNTCPNPLALAHDVLLVSSAIADHQVLSDPTCTIAGRIDIRDDQKNKIVVLQFALKEGLQPNSFFFAQVYHFT